MTKTTTLMTYLCAAGVVVCGLLAASPALAQAAPEFSITLDFDGNIFASGSYRLGTKTGSTNTYDDGTDEAFAIVGPPPAGGTAYFQIHPHPNHPDFAELAMDFRPPPGAVGQTLTTLRWLLVVQAPELGGINPSGTLIWSKPIRHYDAAAGGDWNAATDAIFMDGDESGTYTAADLLLAGTAPAIGTPGAQGARAADWTSVKTYDAEPGGMWDPGHDAIVFDTNANNQYDENEPILAGTTPITGKALAADAEATDWCVNATYLTSGYGNMRVYKVAPATTAVDANSRPVLAADGVTDAPELVGSSKDMRTTCTYSGITDTTYFVIELSVGNYQPPTYEGYLQVTIAPNPLNETDPIRNAQWKVTKTGFSSDSFPSGHKLQLPTGQYELSCTKVWGWYTTPAPVAIEVTTSHTVNTPLQRTMTYTRQTPGTVTTTIAPAVMATQAGWWLAVNIGSGWSSPARLNSGDTEYPPYAADTYVIDFDNVDGWTRPPNIENINVQAGSNRIYPRSSPNQYEATYYGVVASPTAITTTESGGSAMVAITLSRPPSANVTVTPSVIWSDGGGTAPANVAQGRFDLTFTTANWSTPQYITVAGDDDGVPNDGGGRAYQVQLAAASTDTNYNGLIRAAVQGFTIDNDTAGINISQSVGLVTTEDGGVATVDVSLNAQPTGDVTVTIVSTDATEGKVSSASDQDGDVANNSVTWTFTTGNWNTAQTLTITGQPDGLLDGNVPYLVTLTFASGDASYNGQVRALMVTNTDSQSPTIGDYDLVTFLPSSSVDFGQTTVAGSARYGSVTIFNGEATPVTLYVSTSSSSQFGVKDIAQLPTVAHVAGTSVAYTIAAGSMATVNLKYTAGVSAAVHNDTLTFQYNDGLRAMQTLKVITLTGATIASAPGGTLGINPSYAVARGTTTDTVTINVVLNSSPVAYTQCSFLLAVPPPAVVTALSSATDTTRTNGIAFSQRLVSAGVYAFDYTDFSGTGITAGSGTIMTLTLTVDVSGSAAAYPLTLYDITAVRSSTGYSVSPQAALLAVSSTLATLDVNGDVTPTVNMTDIILCYRWTTGSTTKYQVTKIAPDSYKPGGMSSADWEAAKAQYAARAQNLTETGRLDISGDLTPTVNMTDIILCYRWTTGSTTKFQVTKVAPDSYKPGGMSSAAWEAAKTQYSLNVQNMMP